MANLPLVTVTTSAADDGGTSPSITTGSTPQSAPATTTEIIGLPPRPRRCCFTLCCPGYQSQQPWTAERVAHLCSNLFILMGTLTALVFAIYAAHQVTSEYLVLTVFIVCGTVFGGACLLALVNVSWMSRRPGVRISAIQVICNIVLFLITSYLGLLFWPYPSIAYSIIFAAGLPMLVMINLPSCFVKKTLAQLAMQEGGTVCLDQDAMDDATIVDYDLESPVRKEENPSPDSDETQRTNMTEDDSSDDMDDVDVEFQA